MGRTERDRTGRQLDDVVASLVKKIRGGQTNAAAVLADYLEENNLPYAKSVREAWQTLQNEENEIWSKPPSYFRGAARWERIAQARAKLRKTIGSIYGRYWSKLPPKRYMGRA